MIYVLYNNRTEKSCFFSTCTERKYKNWKINESTDFYEDWSIKEKRKYKNWKISESMAFYESWSVKEKWFYNSNGNLLDIEYYDPNWNNTVEYYENWQIKIFRDYRSNWKLRTEKFYNEKWDYDWKRITYHENWQIEEEKHFIDWKRDYSILRELTS